MLSLLDEILEKQDSKLKVYFSSEIFGYALAGTYKEKDYSLKTLYKFQLPNKVKIQVILPDGKKYTEGYNGSKSWEMDKYVDGRAADALRHGAEWPNYIKSIKDCVKIGLYAEYIGVESIHQEDYHKIKLTQKDGFSRHYFIHAVKFEIHYTQDVRPLHPNDDKKLIQSEFLRYTATNGVKIPLLTIERDLDTGQMMTKLIIKEVKINPNFSKIEFEKLNQIP